MATLTAHPPGVEKGPRSRPAGAPGRCRIADFHRRQGRRNGTKGAAEIAALGIGAADAGRDIGEAEAAPCEFALPQRIAFQPEQKFEQQRDPEDRIAAEIARRHEREQAEQTRTRQSGRPRAGARQARMARGRKRRAKTLRGRRRRPAKPYIDRPRTVPFGRNRGRKPYRRP